MKKAATRYRINQELKFPYAKKTTTQQAATQSTPGMSKLLAKHLATNPNDDRQQNTATNGNILKNPE